MCYLKANITQKKDTVIRYCSEFMSQKKSHTNELALKQMQERGKRNGGREQCYVAITEAKVGQTWGHPQEG